MKTKHLCIAGLAMLAALVWTSCQSSSPTDSKKAEAKPPKPASRRASEPRDKTPSALFTKKDEGRTKVNYSSKHDAEIEAILELASKGRWEEAETRSQALSQKAPLDSMAQRVTAWVGKQRQIHREQALEQKIRQIDAKSSQFNPTVTGLIKEHKDRGLPPRQDVRDAVEQIEAIPYIPPSYGKKIEKQGILFDVETKEGRMAKVLNRVISVHLDNVTLEAIIFNIGQAEGINFVADKALPAFKQTLSVNMDKARLSEFLQYVSRNLDLQFQVGDDLIWVVDAKDPKRILEETRFYKLKQGFIIPAKFGSTEMNRTSVSANNVVTTTENEKFVRFVNDGAPISPAIETAIKQFFVGSKYMIDYERNLIIARGTREQLEMMEKLIEEFDRPVQQVLIEARFITITEAAYMQLGALWESARDTLKSRNAKDITGLGTDLELGLGLEETFTQVLSRQNLSVTIDALEQNGESQTLSAPRLTVINNLPATINDGKVQYYYEEYQVKQQATQYLTSSSLVPSGKPVKMTSGVQLDVLASIGGDGRTVMLALHPQVNQDVKLVPFATVTDRDSSGKVVSTFDIRLPESRTQELSTRVMVKSGETVVMGGVLEREQRTLVESIPVLGNLPLIGAAFRRRTEIDKPRYLLIFVTATVLSDKGEFLVYEEKK